MLIPEKFRKSFPFAPFVENDQTGGFFRIPHNRIKNYYFNCLANTGADWEHVTITVNSKVSKIARCPTWQEMCFIKGMFWEGEDTVMQIHPPESDYVNNHPYCLHLWKPVKIPIPRPPSIMVGVKNKNLL